MQIFFFFFLASGIFCPTLSSKDAVRDLKWLEVKSELAAEEIKTPYMKSVCSFGKDFNLGGNYPANLEAKCIKSPKVVIRSFYRRNMKWEIRHLPLTPHK